MATRRKTNTIDQEDVFLTEQQIYAQQQLLAQQQQENLLQLPHADVSSDEDIEDIDSVRALNNVLAGIGATTEASRGLISVYKEKIVNGTKGEEYLGEFSVLEFSEGNLLNHLQNTYSAGKYHIRVYAPNENHKMVMMANKFIDIASAPGVLAHGVPSPTAQPVDLTPVLTAINQQQANFERLLSAIVAAQPKPKTTLESLEEMKLMREVFAPAQVAPPVQYNPIEMMKMGMEMAQMGSGGENNNMWVGKMIDAFSPVVNTIIEQQVKAKAAPAAHAPAPRPHVAPGALPAVLATPQPDEGENDMSLMIKIYFKKLASAAAQNHPVEDYANEILDMLPGSELPQFDAMLRAPDWQSKLAAHSGAVNDYPAWFNSLRSTIIEFRDSDIAEAYAINNAGLTKDAPESSVDSHENDNSPTPAPDSNAGGPA